MSLGTIHMFGHMIPEVVDVGTPIPGSCSQRRWTGSAGKFLSSATTGIPVRSVLFEEMPRLLVPRD